MEAEARLLIERLDAPVATASLEAIRALQKHAIAAVGGQGKARGVSSAFLAERRDEWDET